MININYQFSKQKINKEKAHDYLLIEIEGHKKNDKNKKRSPLNLSFVIDCSGSMGVPIKHTNQSNQLAYNPLAMINDMKNNQNSFLQKNNEIPHPKSKMQLAKEAVINAIELLDEQDILSLISFDDNIQVEAEPMKMTKENKDNMIKRVQNIQHKGLTNLHSGWFQGAKEVSKNISKEKINRVIVFTDGQTNSGIINPDEIATNVLELCKTSITTSTFGIGEDFNEDLLQAMAYSGSGNSYYIQNNEEFSAFFDEEINGLLNLCAIESKAQIVLNKNFSIATDYQDFAKDNDFILLPNIVNNKKITLFYKINTTIKNKNTVKIGDFIFKYKDENGECQEKNIKINIDICDDKEWQKLEFNNEVMVKKALYTVAKKRDEALKAIDNGNAEMAKNILQDSIKYSKNYLVKDDRIDKEIAKLNSTISSMSSGNISSIRKDISYASYQTKLNRD